MEENQISTPDSAVLRTFSLDCQRLKDDISQFRLDLRALEALQKGYFTDGASHGKVAEKFQLLYSQLKGLSQRYDGLSSGGVPGSFSSTHKRLWNTKLQNLGWSLQTLTSALTDGERLFQSRTQRQLESRLSLVMPTATPQQLAEYAKNPSRIGETRIFSVENSDLRVILEDLQLRHEDLLDLEKSVKELAEIFRHLSDLVASQGDQIRQLGDEVEETENIATKIEKNMVGALKKTKGKRMLKIILLVVVSLLVLVALGYAGSVLKIFCPH